MNNNHRDHTPTEDHANENDVNAQYINDKEPNDAEKESRVFMRIPITPHNTLLLDPSAFTEQSMLVRPNHRNMTLHKHYASIALDDDRLMVCGGLCVETDKEMADCYIYSLSANAAVKLASMINGRYDFPLFVLNGNVFAVRGYACHELFEALTNKKLLNVQHRR